MEEEPLQDARVGVNDRVIGSRIHMNLRPLDPGGGHVTHQEIHVSKDHVNKDTWRNQMVTSVKVQLAF
jgi:hypothetical protein